MTNSPVETLAKLVGLVALFAPMAHLLELPNKLALDAPLWLAVQQNLYRGWGPLVGAPTEIGALALTALAAVRSREPAARRLWIAAALFYAGMLAAFFLLNAPANASISSWRADTMPADWTSYRARWETGHAIAAILALAGYAAASIAARIGAARLRLVES